MIAFVVVFRKLFSGIRSAWKDPAFRGTLQLAIALIVVGTFFYARVEGWRLLNALYFCVCTLTTVGYGDFTPHTAAGKVFTIFYVLIGLGVVITVATEIASHATKRKAA